MSKLGTTDIAVSKIVLGTWQADPIMWGDISDKQLIDTLKAAFDAGITTIDTAGAYGNGRGERLIARALKNKRPQAVIASKVIIKLSYPGVIKSCEKSLRNLASDYLDLYYIHWPSGQLGEPKVPIKETMHALNDLKQQGKIRAIGVSNFSLEQLQEAQQYGSIDAIQPPYSLIWRGAEKDLIPYCQANNISVFSYSSLAGGLLTGKYRSDHQFGEKDLRQYMATSQDENRQYVDALLTQLEPFAEKYQTTLAGLCLAWIFQQPQLHAIVGAKNPQQATANAKAMQVTLSDADFTKISELSHLVTEHIKTPTLLDLVGMRKLKS